MTTPLNRRAMLGRLASAAALTFPTIAVAVVPADPDAEVIALSAEIVRRTEQAELFQETRIDPFAERFLSLGRDYSKPSAVRWEDAWTFSRESGRDAAIEALEEFDEETDRLFRRFMAIPATTQLGRAAKVRAFIAHAGRSNWRGPAEKLGWAEEMARALLGEFAGMSAADLEAI